MLEIKQLTKVYNQKKVLNDISLTVKEGEIALLIGPSGVGKSTLLRILNNLESYDRGTINLDEEILDISQVNKNHRVGMVFQQFNLFDHMSVERNITFALERSEKKTHDESVKIAHELLKKYDLLDKAQLSVNDLSGGQKQRLAIARTLALKPRVLCLDEPTSALDPMLTNFVAQNIQALAQEGYIVLVATHDTDLIQKLNSTIYLLGDGAIKECAKSEEFKKHNDQYPHIKRFVEGVDHQS